MGGYQTLNEAYLSVYEGFVPLNRDKYAEELEFVLDYLFENGYADNYESAAVIAESMSDEWFEDILCEWDWEHLKKHSLSNQPTHITGKTPPVLKPSDFENPDSDEAKAKKERRKARQKRLEFEVR